MNVTCFQEEELKQLAVTLAKYVIEKHLIKDDKWISGEEAMKKLRITSKTTLQNLRDQGKIRFTQPEKKHILYDSDSINDYLNKHAKNPF